MKRFISKMETGQALVEWALVFPIFWLLICVVIDFSWLGYQQLLFEGAFQVTAWDFPLITKKSNGEPLSDKEIIEHVIPDSYSASSPAEVIKIGSEYYPLGEGLRLYLLKSSPGLLNSSWLSVTDAGAQFEVTYVPEVYVESRLTLESYELRVNLEADLEYKVKLLTPVTQVFFSSDEVILQKKLVRKRVERVAVKRQVMIPGGG